jgi:pilus assembly protein CpaE
VSFVTAKNVGFKPAPGKAAATNTRVILLAEQTIIVTGSKGGAGTTTVALNVAMQIAQLTKKRTALVELARPFGQIALMLDIEPRFTLLDALDRGERLDAAVLASLMTRHKIGVEMLLGARHLALTADQRQRATIDGLLHILETAQSVYDFVVVDLGFVNAAEWARVLHAAGTLLLVSEPSELALGMLQRYLEAVDSAGLEREHFRIVINRARQNDEEMIFRHQSSLRQTFFAQLPNDYRQVSDAVKLGIPLVASSNNPLVARYRQMAGQLVNPSGLSANLMPEAEASVAHK